MALSDRYTKQDNSTDKSTTHIDVLKRTAKERARYTHSYFAQTGKSFSKFIDELKKLPFNITINPNDPESVTLGVYALQKDHLGFPETDNRTGCDGMCGPVTHRAFQGLLVARQAQRERIEVGAGDNPSLQPVIKERPPEPRTKHDTARTEHAPETRADRPPVLSEVPHHKVAFVGDSLTIGMKDAVPDINLAAARGAQETGWMRKNFDKWLTEKETGKYPGIEQVVFLGGVNDIANGKRLNYITENLEYMYKKAREAGLRVVACTMFAWDTKGALQRIQRRQRERGWKVYPDNYDEVFQQKTLALNNWIQLQEGRTVDRVVDLYAEMGAFDSKQYERSEGGLHLKIPTSQAVVRHIFQNAGTERAS